MLYETTIKQHYWSARHTLGWRLSKWGERLGVDAFTYNSVVFDEFGRVAAEVAPLFAEVVLELLPTVRRVVDVGCGTGHFVRAFRNAGVESDGFEHSKHARQAAKKTLSVELRPLDLERDPAPGVRADLAISIEVAEHVPPALGERLVQILCQTAPIVLFTAAQPGQGGTGHVNEQPLEYWQARFKACAFRYDRDVSARFRKRYGECTGRAPWIARNAMVFRRENGTAR